AAAWSPDGTTLAFTPSCGGGCGSAGDPYHGLRIFDPATGDDRLLFAGEAIGPIAFSPDGSRIVYAVGAVYRPAPTRWAHQDLIWVMNADGSGRRELTRATFLTPIASPADGH